MCSDPPDEDLLAAFQQYSREKNGSGLNAEEQLARLKVAYPAMHLKYVVSTILGIGAYILSDEQNYMHCARGSILPQSERMFPALQNGPRHCSTSKLMIVLASGV